MHLARVLAQIGIDGQGEGRYLLPDEPTASLDLAHRHATMATVRRLAAQGIGTLVILQISKPFSGWPH